MGLAAMGEIPSRDVRVENVEQGNARPDEVVAKALATGLIWPSTRAAFFEDEAAAIRVSAPRTASTNRRASG